MRSLARIGLCFMLASLPAWSAAVTVLGTDMTLNGNALVSGSSVQLTAATSNQNGSAWRTAPVSTSTSFTSTFSFSLTGTPTHADGISFAMQNAGLTALGFGGGSLGVNGISNQVNLSIRTFFNNQIGFGNNTTGSKAAPGAMGSCSSVVGTVTVGYDLATTTLALSGSYVACGSTYTVSDTMVLNLAGKFGSTMYVGFTGATGGSVATQSITSWTFTTPQPSYYPSGPRSNVSLSTITSGGWTQCYSQSMATLIGNSGENVTNACKGDYLMMAGRTTGNTMFLALAATKYTEAVQNTGGGSNFISSNGSKWWYTPNWSWGFVAAADGISNGSCNTANGTLGMCLHTSASGGYRINNLTGLNGSTDYEKVFFVSNGLPKLDHIEVTASSNTGVTCAPTTYTLKACSDAACTTPYTGGLTGTLTLTGTGVTANFPSGAAFTIASGSSTTTVVGQVTTPSTATVGATGLSLTPGNVKSLFCGLGVAANSTNACTITVADAGFLLAVPHHRAGYSQTVALSAVKKADNSLACAAAFTGTQTVNVGCSYLNPSTGTKPLLVGGTAATNTSTNPAGTCNGSTSSRSLVFDANGQTTTTVQYDDVGQMQLSVSASGSGNSAGLSLTGTANFVIAPFKGFLLTNQPGSAIAAGSPFGYTITAVNAALAATPNFGRETPPESITMSWVRNQPTGTNAVDGSFSTGTPAAVANGAVGYSNASWSEVGRATLSARLSSGSYLGSGFSTVTSSAAAWQCATENGTCVVPAGTTATVSFDAGGAYLFFKHGLTGNVPCTSAYFGDPKPGGSKSCWMLIESGVYSPATGALLFKPHHFDVSTSNACGSFSYAGQPFGATVTAKNLGGNTTLNYDGTADTSPNFAKAVNFSDITASPPGSLSGSLAASAFNRGVGSVVASGANAPVYSFSNKLAAAQSISLRATDTDGVSSSGYTEGSMALRSGRLQMSNAFGGDKSSLQIPLQLQYWSGKSWVKNSDDTCTVIPTASVVLARRLNHNNEPASWTSAVSGLTLSGGSGFITLAAPSPSGTGTVDLAINLGVGLNTQDLSCLSNHPNTTGAGLPWLRSRQGSCASTFDRDPSARGTFGVYTPETQRSVHVREVF